MAKQLVTVIDSAGREFRSRHTWAEHKRIAGQCAKGDDGVYRFRRTPQSNVAAGSAAGFPVHRRRTVALPPVRLAPTDPTPNTNGDFLPYPYPTQNGRSLSAKFPGLAQMGAGL